LKYEKRVEKDKHIIKYLFYYDIIHETSIKIQHFSFFNEFHYHYNFICVCKRIIMHNGISNKCNVQFIMFYAENAQF